MSRVYLIILFSICLISCKKQGEPVNLLCENTISPIDIETDNPRLSWQINDTTRGAGQTAYQIQVASTPEKLRNDKPDIWNSLKINSNQNILILYTGPKLNHTTRYYWRVKIWDEKGNESSWSTSSWWETGMMGNRWKAGWITKADANAPLRSIMFRNTFLLGRKIVSARTYVCGLGSYELYLNGQKVSNDCFAPGWTYYSRRLNYQVYDVTNLVKEGGNAVGAMLGNMWWSSPLTKNGFRYSSGPLRFIMQLVVTYANGKADTLVTNEQWKSAFSPVAENSLYNGELYDARQEQPGWSSSGFDDCNWENVKTDIRSHEFLTASAGTPVVPVQKLKAQKIITLTNGEYLFDFGQNIAGYAELNVHGNPGESIKLRYGELLYTNGTIATENQPSARSTDTYITRGDPRGESWHPHFTYHGFRYVQVSGLNNKPDTNTLIAYNIQNQAPITGTFESSSTMLNCIWKNARYAQISNMIEVLTSSPQCDERFSSAGNLRFFASSAVYGFDMYRFFGKSLTDIADCQKPSGEVNQTNPTVTFSSAGPGEGDLLVILPWLLYTHYGDTFVLKHYYKNMKAWMSYEQNQCHGNTLYFADKNKDWGSLVPVKETNTSALWFYQDLKIMAQIASVIGYTDDAEQYTKLAQQLAKAYHVKFYSPIGYQYKGNSQFGNLIPLALGITPQSKTKQVIKALIDNIYRNENHLNTGIPGTAFLLPVLSENGYHSMACALALNETYPSWGYMVQQGATSIWERWDSDHTGSSLYGSRNSVALASINQWLFENLGGIKPIPEFPGFKKFSLAPQPDNHFQYVKTSYRSPYGLIKSEWYKKDKNLLLKFCIPANSSAIVEIPATNPSKILVREGKSIVFAKGKPDVKYPWVKQSGTKSDGRLWMEFVSGNYSLTIE
jgi:alpha-L-rhamnosidase